MRALILLATLVLLAVPSASRAQDTRSADQIIDRLRPRPVVPPPVQDTRAQDTRGFQFAKPAETPPPPPPAPPSIDLSVQFATGSAELTPAAVRTLDELGRALSSDALKPYRFRIEGHTDTVGTPAHNKALSEQRANAVVQYLVNRFSVDGARLEAAGMGQERLLVQTGPQRAEPRNRRVQVVNISA